MKYNNWFCEKYRKKAYSQHGEEGVLERLFEILGIGDGYIVDIGINNGKWNSNTFYFLERGFSEFGVEKSEGKAKELNELSKEYKLKFKNCAIEEEGNNSADSLFEEFGVPKDFDLLNIDIDSIDYFIWKSIIKYKPKIVLVEIEPRYGPFKEYLPDKNLPYDNTRRPSNQASYKCMLDLGKEKGYSLVGTLSCNMFFIRNDLKDKLNIPDIFEEPLAHLDKAWARSYYD